LKLTDNFVSLKIYKGVNTGVYFFSTPSI